jgi:type I restriction enzyme S subunit
MVMSTFETVKLGDHINTQKGYAFKSQWYTQEGVPIVKVSNFTDDSVDTSSLVCIPEDLARNYKNYELKTGDIIIQTVGSWPSSPQSVVGKVIRVPARAARTLLNQNAVKISPDSSLHQPFVYYVLRSNIFKEYIINCAQGAASQASITLDAIREFRFKCPPLLTQRKIAAILSAYDRLIENNTRRIEILEEMARSIYREWFVKFRFPGHEQVQMVDSELGLIPEGWEVKKLEKVADINASTIKPSNAPEEINYIDISSVSTGKIDKIEPIALSNASSRARRIVKQGDIIWSTVRPNRKSYSLILNPIPNLIVSTGFAVVTPKKAPYTYLYHALTTNNFVGYLTNNATGSAYPAVNTGDFKNAEVLIPRIELMNKFHNIVADIFSEKDNFLRKNINLRQTRDLLLPRLISGEIDVENLDINTGPIAA